MSYLGGGLATLDRWEGLKEWHRRHQDLLEERSIDMRMEGIQNGFQSLMSNMELESSSLQHEDTCPKEEINVGTILGPKHDLSIIPEADEDSRSKDADFHFDKQRSEKICLEPNRVISKSNEESRSVPKKSMPNVQNSGKPNGVPQNNRLESHADQQKGVKRPFLRKGQGLIKYNLQPEDLKRPYQKATKKKIGASEVRNFKRASSFPMRHQEFKRPVGQSSTKRVDSMKATELAAPMQRLVLSIPSHKPSAPEIGTWSQVLSGGGGSLVSNSHGNNTDSCEQSVWKEDTCSPKTLQSRFFKGGSLSPRRRREVVQKHSSSPEEDQESLAAYLDLEQHVGNASFCSTSSKVDRLVTKSSHLAIHQSNPDAITQMKQLTPIKTGRKFFSGTQHENTVPKDHQSLSTTELENLVKARARRSSSLVKIYPESGRSELEKQVVMSEIAVSDELRDANGKPPSCGLKSTPPEPQVLDWMIEVLGPVRKPHLMKTAPNIDLDSSLIKNAQTPKLHDEEHDLDSEMESSETSSESSSEEDYSEDFLQGVRGKSKYVTQKEVLQENEEPQKSKEDQKVTRVPLKLVDDASLEEINNQIEAHLSDLRKEIETLQAAKGKTQMYISRLEKKVQELEHRIALDSRSFNKQLEDERQAAAKRLSEEQAKFSKEKQALQRTLREERRKAPDPVTQQDILRLKQEITTWEEKWRTDRAKARGLESNLRIQITNFKRENDKLKEENLKLQREKETALSTAKARAASNTRVINSIAQQLGSSKPKASCHREENCKLNKRTTSSAYKLRSQPNKEPPHLRPVATIENFSEHPLELNEWSSDEEIDLGKETSDEDDLRETVNVPPSTTSFETSPKVKETSHPLRGATILPKHQLEAFDLQATQAKYDAIFGSTDVESVPLTTPDSGPADRDVSSSANPILQEENRGPTSTNVDSEKYMKSIQHPDGKIEQIKANGTRVITYPDGTWERHSSSGSVMTVPPAGWPVHISYFNGDRLEKLQDGTTRYCYAKSNVWQTTFPDGHEELQYPSGQMERRESDGSVKVLLPGADAHLNERHLEPACDSIPSEISVQKLPNGDSIILLPTGEREIHTKDYMKKEFLDGTVKFLYKDGVQETRYPSGRIRVKDAMGNLIKDTSET